MFLPQQIFHIQCLFFFARGNTQNCYYFESNLSLILHIKVLLIEKKACNIACSLLNLKKTVPHEFIFLFTIYIIGAILLKKVVKGGEGGGVSKIHKVEDSYIKGCL